MYERGEAKETISHILRKWKLFEEFRVDVKRKTFPSFCTEAILQCKLPEAVDIAAGST
jgi:hypothetical protein